MMKWMYIIVLAVLLSLSLSGCADTADAESSAAITPVENQEETTNTTNDETIWAAIVMTWNPVVRTIDKEFTSEVDCWNYYETETNGVSVGESKFGTQHLDHQGNRPTKDFNFGPDYLEYPIRTYRGKDGQGSVWLTCDTKGRYKGL